MSESFLPTLPTPDLYLKKCMTNGGSQHRLRLTSLVKFHCSKVCSLPPKNTKPGKDPGPDSICPELIIHTEAALKSWLCRFLSSYLHHLSIFIIWRRALESRSQSHHSLQRSLRAIIPSLCSMSPTKSSKGLSTLVLNMLLIHSSLKMLDFDTENLL